MASTKTSDSSFGIAKLVGEGFGRPQAVDGTPVDIQYGKLAEWLGTRKHLPVDWRKRLRAIQAAVSTEAKTLPPQLSSDEAIDFFAAQHILDALAEGADKGYFGGLKGQAGTWDKMVKAYQKQNVHLGEAGNTLTRNVDFEIPYFKKQAEKLQQQIADHEHRHEEYLRNADTASKDYQQECRELGISGSNIPQALSQLQQQLPSLYADALTAVNDAAITDAMQHYATFTAYAHSSTATEASPATAAVLLPHLESIRKLNTVLATPSSTDTTAQPDQGISDQVDQGSGAAADMQPRATEKSVDIDWDVLAVPEADAALATDSAPATSTEATGEVNWDIEIEADAAATDATQPDADVQGTDIDWDIDMTEHAQEQADGVSTAEASAVDIEGTGASLQAQQWPESAVRMSNDTACRTSVLDDLHELDSYLHQRAQELSSGSQGPLATALFDADQASLSDVQHQQAAVRQLLEKLASDKVQQLVMIKTSKQYLSRLERKLKQKAGQHDKFLKLADELQKKQEEHHRALKSNAMKLQALLQQTRQVKGFVEGAVSALCDNRTVHIIGDINKVI